MESCPFCHSEVSEDLVRFGGRCPKCFGEIPGEESPTDPGHETRQELEAADLKAAGRRSLVPALLVAIAAVSLLGIAIYVSVPEEPVATVIDFDDAAYDMVDVPFVAYVEPEPVAPAPRRVAPRPKPDRLKAIRSLEVGDVGGDVEPTEALAAGPEPSAMPEPTTRQGAVGDPEEVAVADGAGDEQALQSGAVDFGIDVGVSRRATKGVRLTDDSAIIEMIKDVMSAELPRLKSCYEQQLKVVDDLSGRWTLAFVVDHEGFARDVAVVGQGVDDADLESCITAKVVDWEFQPIRADQPVQKTLTFRPGW